MEQPNKKKAIEKYSIYYQLQGPGGAVMRGSLDDLISADEPTWIPSPGDSITLRLKDEWLDFIVLSRHFTFEFAEKLVYHNVHVLLRPATEDEIDSRYYPG